MGMLVLYDTIVCTYKSCRLMTVKFDLDDETS